VLKDYALEDRRQPHLLFYIFGSRIIIDDLRLKLSII